MWIRDRSDEGRGQQTVTCDSCVGVVYALKSVSRNSADCILTNSGVGRFEGLRGSRSEIVGNGSPSAGSRRREGHGRAPVGILGAAPEAGDKRGKMRRIIVQNLTIFNVCCIFA